MIKASGRPPGYLGTWPPVCGDCGHRHAPGMDHAGHVWDDSCPYDAGAECAGPGLRPFRETGPAPFTCPRCARTSYHPQDLEEGYCGACHDWTGRPDVSGTPGGGT